MAFPADLAAAAARELGGIFKEARDVLSQGEGNYIRDGEPQGVVASIGLAAARQTCRRWAANPGSVSPGAQVGYDRACSPYLKSIGQYSQGVAAGNPLPGGQCVGVAYQGDYTSLQSQGNPPVLVPVQSNISLGFGPLTSTFVDDVFAGFPRRRYSITGFANPTGTGPTVVATPEVFANFASGNPRVRNGNVRVFRTDGQADNCGSLPPVVQPPPPGPTAPRRQPYNPGPDINIDIDIDIQPDGDIDFDIGTGPITVNPNPRNDPTGVPAEEPGDQGDPGSAVPATPGDPAEDEAPPGKVLVGLLVTVVSGPPNQQRFIDPNVWRWPCWVYIGGESGLDLDPGGQYIRSPQFVNSETDNATRWRVDANLGFVLSVTPFYKDAEE